MQLLWNALESELLGHEGDILQKKAQVKNFSYHVAFKEIIYF